MEKRYKNTIVFLIGTLLITWTLYVPIPLLGWSPYSFPGVILLFFGGSAPTWLAVIMIFITYNKEQRRDYFQRLYRLKRIKPIWWLALILLFPAIVAAAIGLSLLFGGSMPEMTNLKVVIANPLIWFPLVGLSFMSGPFSEELGWRGYALEPLLGRFGFTKASVLLGLIWGVWHLPLFFMPQTWHGQIGFAFAGFWVFILENVGLALIMSWVYINTKRSILTALLLHLSSNFSAQLVAQADSTFEMIRGLLILVIGIGVSLYVIKAKKDSAATYALPTMADIT